MKKLAVLNLISLITAGLVSYLGNSQAWNGNTMGSLSQEYYNLFTPAGYAFSIWGLIYIALFAYCLFHLKRAFSKGNDASFVRKTDWWFFIANMANAAWVCVAI